MIKRTVIKRTVIKRRRKGRFFGKKSDYIKMMKYEDATTAFLKKQFRTRGRKDPVRTESKESFEMWQRNARENFCRILSLPQMEHCEPLPFTYEYMTMPGGYVRERAIVQTEPEVWMPYFLLRKEEGAGKKPAVIVLPHSGAGKFSVVNSEDYEFYEKQTSEIQEELRRSWAFASALADAGFLVAAPDLRGMGERREWMDEGEENFMHSSRRAVNNVALSLGLSLAGMDVWEISVLADVLRKRSDCSGNISIGGSREAGVTALYCAAAVPGYSGVFAVDGLAGFEEGALTIACYNCSAYVPKLMLSYDSCDIAALAAPQQLLLQFTSDNPLNGENGKANVEPQLNEVRNVYAVVGAENALKVCWPDQEKRTEEVILQEKILQEKILQEEILQEEILNFIKNLPTNI